MIIILISILGGMILGGLIAYAYALKQFGDGIGRMF